MVPPLVQDLIEFDYARQPGPVAVPPHVHHFCQMDVILAGTMDVRTRGGRTVLKKGDGTLIPPLSPHGYNSTGAVHHATFKIRVHPRYAAMLGHAPRIVRFEAEHLVAAKSAARSSQSGEPLGVHGVIAAATICLIHALRNRSFPAQATGSSPLSSHTFWGVLNEVIASPHADWTVGRLAQRCHLSAGHFTKTFLRVFGQTPQRFLLEARIWGAADRLNQSDASIKDVAQIMGYATVHSFSRAFKRVVGVSPAAYVKSQGRL